MMRTTTWKQDLWNLLEVYRHEPFAWGTHDCSTFAYMVMETVTGKAPELHVAWQNEAEALAIISVAGGLEALVSDHLGQSVNWGACRAGDIVLCNLPTGATLAVNDGTQLMAPGPSGLRRIPFSFAVCGWKI